MSICFFDIETTGLDKDKDEILQVSIMDEGGKVILNKYYKPEEVKNWDKAQEINGITKRKVRKCYSAKYQKDEIQKAFDKFDTFVGYCPQFDVGFLEKIGIKFKGEVIDVMELFLKKYPEKANTHGRIKLKECADIFGYRYLAHNSLEDIKATKYVYEAIQMS